MFYYQTADSVNGSVVNYTQLFKIWVYADDLKEKRFCPPKSIETSIIIIFGYPDMEVLSTSQVERHNLSC